MTGFFTAPRIAWGPGAIEQLSGLGAQRAVVVVDPTVARAGGHRRIVEELAKSDTVVELVEDLENPVRRAELDRLTGRLRASPPDWVVAVGGGRTIDGVKAARFAAERAETEWETLTPILDLPEAPRIRCVAVPTTSGSGSEASWTSDLFQPDGTPLEVAHRALVPEWALLDPEFARSLPAEVRIDGALETAVQALEAYLSAWANPFSDALAVDALATVLERLPHALRWSDDPEAKEALHFAATAAGLAASNAQRGLAHALARALVGPTGLSYGRLLGVVVLSVLEFDRASARDRLEALATEVMRGESPTRLALSNRFARLFETFRVPTDLASAGVPLGPVEAQREAIVSNVLRSPGVLANPRVPSRVDVERLVDNVAGKSRTS